LKGWTRGENFIAKDFLRTTIAGEKEKRDLVSTLSRRKEATHKNT